jgi:hypothetical protein
MLSIASHQHSFFFFFFNSYFLNGCVKFTSLLTTFNHHQFFFFFCKMDWKRKDLANIKEREDKNVVVVFS